MVVVVALVSAPGNTHAVLCESGSLFANYPFPRATEFNRVPTRLVSDSAPHTKTLWLIRRLSRSSRLIKLITLCRAHPRIDFESQQQHSILVDRREAMCERSRRQSRIHAVGIVDCHAEIVAQREYERGGGAN